MKTFIETILLETQNLHSPNDTDNNILQEPSLHIPLLKEHYNRYCSTVGAHSDKAGLSEEEFELSICTSFTKLGLFDSTFAFRCRLIYTETGDIESISIDEVIERQITTVACIEASTIRYRFKSTNRSDFRELATQFPQFDELIITQGGFLSDGTFTNIYLVPQNNTHYPYPTPSHNLLMGCRRAQYIKQEILIPKPIHISSLKQYAKIGFINALHPLGRLGELPIQAIQMIVQS